MSNKESINRYNTLYYILDENNQPVPEPDIIKWAQAWENNRMVKQDYIGDILISTIFLGINMDMSCYADKNRKPILWETMVFKGELDGEQIRYDSLKKALKGHKFLVDKINKQKGI